MASNSVEIVFDDDFGVSHIEGRGDTLSAFLKKFVFPGSGKRGRHEALTNVENILGAMSETECTCDGVVDLKDHQSGCPGASLLKAVGVIKRLKERGPK